MKGTLLVIFAVLISAASVLWYIFVYAQSTTAQLNFGEREVVVGVIECAPVARGQTASKCMEVIKDEIGNFFIDKTSSTKKLIVTDRVRAEGYLIQADQEILEDYEVDGYLVDSIKDNQYGN